MNLISPLYPEISLFLGALIILMSDVFLGKKFKSFFYASHFLSLLFCALAIILAMNNFLKDSLSFNQMFITNTFTSFTKVIAIMLLTVVILLSLHFVSAAKKISAEFLALLMIATTGGMILISANDFLVFYLGLELQALSLYLLAAINRASTKSSEAGMKYFILGSVASGILLFGISMIYGFSGTTNFGALTELYHGSQALNSPIPVAVMFGFILVITAMFFKISAAPFHMWTPDVYEGSAPIVTTFFATVVKFIAVLTLLRLASTLIIGWNGIDKVIIFTATLSLAFGSFGAIFQKNLKRLLAYSSIGHVGFILLGLASFTKDGFAACVLYMIIYSVISMGSFAFVILVRSANSAENELESDEESEKTFNIQSLAGLAKTNPTIAFCLSILIFSSAGIPPLAGFFSKFYILVGALSAGLLIPSILAVLFSVISAYYYLRIIKIMYFDEAKESAIKLVDFGNVKIVIICAALFNIALIAFLNPLLNLIKNFLVF